MVPLVIGVTSHRNLAAHEVEPLRQHVRDFFAQLKRDFPELPLMVLSALAEGGDQLVAQEALAAGATLTAPLPLSPQAYASDFTDAGRATFAALCQRADVLQLPLLPGNSLAGIAVHGEERDRQYAQSGVFIASHCHILLALWDGRASRLLGGTAQVVRFHLDGLMPGLIERRQANPVTLDDRDESLLYHIACSRTDEHGLVQPPLPPLQPLQSRWVSQEHTCPGDAGMPDEFLRMFARMRQFNTDAQNYADYIQADAAGSVDNPADAVNDDLLDGLFASADWLAIHFQKRVLLAMRGIYILAALMGIAFVCYSDLPTDWPYQDNAIYVFIVLFAAGVLLARQARHRDWHRKYVDYRALAEGLRVQHYWHEAGIGTNRSTAFAHDNFMQKQDIELGWIRHVMRAASVHSFDAAVSEDGLSRVIAEWIGEPGAGGQLDYYLRKTEQRIRTHRTTQRLGRSCLWVGIALSVFLALFHRRLSPDTTTILIALMGTLAIIAAARESYAYRKADKELIKQYRYMRSIFATARRKLDAAHTAEGQCDILRALGDASLAEHSEWALMHRERPLEHGKL
ncbi:hypothetical protein B0E48_14280 [Rhodanobacter sp. C03]|nr:hypothetical protein B0E48_14280 [Rhodanobacter sp. C03]